MLSTDRDLLVLEPAIFRDVAWASQRLCRGFASIIGTGLTAADLDVSFELAGVGPGHVVLVDGVGLEVLARTSPAALTVSRPRADVAAPPIPPAPLAGRPCEVLTFAPQTARADRAVRAMLALRPGETLLNPEDLRDLCAALAAREVLLAAASRAGPESPAAWKASMYDRLIDALRGRLVASIDTDGDDVEDERRGLSAGAVTRW